ncbi:hypothetical protein [Halorussus halobius]|uniref:hypothetical protein n=1 Tax=Halorussus halobius TaxID=1710537 RepID=UPI0010933426|nr:hypothetical protein [Halorussus halobius]
MSRRLLVGLFVAALLVGPALAVQPASAASYPDAETVCGLGGDGERLVGYLPGASGSDDARTLTDEQRVYRGTTFRLALCKGSDLAPTQGSEWTVDASSEPGLEALGSADAHVTVRVTDEAEGTVDVLDLVGEKESIDAPVVAVQTAPAVESELANATIRFENASAADEYEAAEREYLAALDDLANATERLNRSADALDAGEVDDVNGTDENVTAVLDGRAALADASAALENRTFETAFRASGRTNALAALSTAQDDEQAARADARASMERYHAALETAAGDARSTALLNLGGALLVGLLVGAVPGWKLTASQLEDIRRDREVNSRVDYSPRVLARAVGLAAVALVLTVGALFAVGDPGALGGIL